MTDDLTNIVLSFVKKKDFYFASTVCWLPPAGNGAGESDMDKSSSNTADGIAGLSTDVMSLFDNLEEGVVILDRERRILFKSRKCALQFGLPEDAASLTELVSDVSRKDWLRAVELAEQEGTFCTVVPGTADSFLRLHICVQTDHRAVISIRTAEPPIDQDLLLGSFERVLAKFDIGLWRIHVPTGELWWSDKCYELLDVEPGPVCTSSYLKDLSPADQNRISRHISMAMTQKGQYAPRFQVQHRDGVRHVQDRASVLQRDAQGKPLSFVGATIDRTHVVELEAQCAALRGEIEEADALRQTGQLTGAVAHDLNNVITVILGNAELLRLQSLPDSTTESLNSIYSAAVHAGALSSGMLDFVRDIPLSHAPVDVIRVVDDSLPLLRALVGKNVAVNFETALDTAMILGDRHRLERALYNLVLNAGQAIRRKGEITISITVADLMVRICVADNGPGIDEDHVHQIFSPFFTTKEGGVGLGLSSVKRMADQHSGYVDVVSPPSGGTKFTIAIPSNTTATPRAVHTASRTPEQDHTVWVVEDELLVRVVTEQLLSTAGYDVRAFSTPERLLDALDREPVSPDVIVTDVMMPTMSGPEMYHAVLKVTPRQKFVFMTGYANDLLASVTNTLERFTVLRKPFHRNELLRAVSSALEPDA